MLVFKPKWQARIKLNPRSAMTYTVAILILVNILK
jgi:hypothetical protein